MPPPPSILDLALTVRATIQIQCGWRRHIASQRLLLLKALQTKKRKRELQMKSRKIELNRKKKKNKQNKKKNKGIVHGHKEDKNQYPNNKRKKEYCESDNQERVSWV
ncbi:MAG: hypothetical protein EZS28_001097 [Streblomastix strix]|uniref:Uncharacterized protein n=1 Tax=Streblomastix strix TaxID=222440 RepID=A0A5J4X872_9EUKA|nr:MAG: hypothetical protein EZS28_001097 [Streblomastix strix]